jgi:hypothetical protein
MRGLEEGGHEVLEVPGVDWAEAMVYPAGDGIAAWRARTWDTVLAYVRREQRRKPIDLFLTYLYPQQVEVSTIEELQRMGVPCVNFFCDNVREFRRVPDEYRPFALHWVPEFEALPQYRAAGLSHIHAPMPCWVPAALRTAPTTETEPPTFIGSADILRRELLARAMAQCANLVVRGAGWRDEPSTSVNGQTETGVPIRLVANQVALARRHGLGAIVRKIEHRLRPLCPPPLPPACVARAPGTDQDYFRISREAKVTLGVNRVPTATASLRRPLAYSRLRDIEAPMLGACYLTEWTAGVERLYDIGPEIEVYHTADELANKLAELIADLARRRSMRHRAQRRALAEHTVGKSIARVAEWLGLRSRS